MGKVTALAITTVLVIGLIAICSWNDRIVHLIALAIIAILVLVTFWYIRKIVNEHPQLATLESKEVIDLAQMQNAAKDHPALRSPSASIDPEPPLIEAPQEEEE